MLYKYYHKGFTLIELMIVMAIIGILATIALPSYQDYIARAQASEALVVTSGLKNDIAAYYWGNRKWPPAGHHTVSAATNLKGKYFEQGDIIVTPDKGTITTTFNDGVNKGKAVILTPTANSENGQIITWKCSGSVGKSRLPLTCQ